ncbi:MAG TPA: lactate racemase domain-containing protein [Anaeromyxobacter sp.]
MPVLLGWGARPLECPQPSGVRLRLLGPPRPPPVPDLGAALDAALAHPTGARPLSSVATARTRVVVVLPGAGRDAPRAELFAAVRRALAVVPDDHLTVAIANGAHAPGSPGRLGLPDEVLRRHRLVNHDGRDAAAMVEMGRTSRDTRVRVNRCVAEADLVVATGDVRPHRVAGWGGGATAIFPGLGYEEDVRQNRALEADPASFLGRADGNPCREDLEEAVRRLGRDTYLVGAVEAGGAALGAVAGDVVLAHREAVRMARPWCEVEAEPAEAVVVSAPLPASASLHRASRLLPAAGLLLREGGTVILAAECPEGAGQPATASEGLLEPGIRRYLPERHALLVVSGTDEATVRAAGASWAPSVAAALERARERAAREVLDALVLPDGTDLVPVRPAVAPPAGPAEPRG